MTSFSLFEYCPMHLDANVVNFVYYEKTRIACFAMNWPGGASSPFIHRLRHWLMLISVLWMCNEAKQATDF